MAQPKPGPEVVSSREFIPNVPFLLGVGRVDGGGIELINQAPDGEALINQAQAADYLGLLRRMLNDDVAQPTRFT